MSTIRLPSWPQAGEREAELLKNVLESPQWGGFHPYIAEFEESFAAFQGCRHGISTFNGTVSLELALSVLGIGEGDEVILPAISFVSSATAVSRLGAIPVFVDVEATSFNIDPDRIPEAVSPRTKAVMAVHFGGTPCRIEEIGSICRDKRIGSPRGRGSRTRVRVEPQTCRKLRSRRLLQLSERKSAHGGRRRYSHHLRFRFC